MTIADDGKFCNSCKKLGLQRKAHRIMAGEGGQQCDEHFREKWGLPQLNEKAKLFILSCKEMEKSRESLPHRAPARKKTKTLHQHHRKPANRTREDRNPAVLDLLDAFNNPMRDPELPASDLSEAPDPESRREPLPGS